MDIWYPKDSGFELTAFSDADHAGCLDTRKSTSGGIQFLGDKLVSWMSKKQNCTAMSSAEAEYVALYASCAQFKDGKVRYCSYDLARPEGSTGTIPLVSVEVLRMKSNFRIKGAKRKKPSIHLGRNWVNTYAVKITKMIADIEVTSWTQ
ncbi:hypothetical protein Tco_0705237 [Tanacetum coccineum]|uniref:RNase H type-1 domain-containing protein n=1 Tax=Tanacetum coccineum TaxID=301880 RepID=A0ABQ4Y4W1_9ASTR